MFVRRKANQSGSFSVQVVDKSNGKYRVLLTVGSSRDEKELKKLESAAQREIMKLTRQGNLELSFFEDTLFLEQLHNGIQAVVPVGSELVLGKLYDEIGFNAVSEILLRHLVICRVVHPGSKLKTVDYLFRHHGIEYNVDEVYRFMDKIHDQYQATLEQISFQHTIGILGGIPQMIFYDVTTLYFEEEDDLRRMGYSKDGKHQNPQIMLGLLVGPNGYPLAFEMFEGDTFEGHTLIPSIEKFKTRFNLNEIIVVADAGLLSADNIKDLCALGYSYILGGKIKNETAAIKQWILSQKLNDKQTVETQREDASRLILSYSSSRAKNDLKNRMRGLKKLEASVRNGKLTKKHINSR
jgi:transposase